MVFGERCGAASHLRALSSRRRRRGGVGANANMMGMGVVAFERLYRAASEGGREGGRAESLREGRVGWRGREGRKEGRRMWMRRKMGL